jgi:glucose/arabinose dehydrogenase
MTPPPARRSPAPKKSHWTAAAALFCLCVFFCGPAEAGTADYSAVPAFGGVLFQEPVEVVFAPGETTRAFVVEREGRIAMVPNINSPVRQVILDLSSSVNPSANDGGHGMLSMAFHPKFAQNGLFYVWTSIWDSAGNRYTRLLRYTLSTAGTVDPVTALTLINQPVGSGGHDGGTLLFGSDGYLYLSIGDGDEGVAGAEALASHQRIDAGFFGAVLRIDVDQNPGNLVPNPHLGQQPTGYLIPADNPFIGATSFNGLPVNPAAVRTEFWAVGFRNPFRMSFDSANGELWVGDVGLNTQEEIDVVTRGSNYGWNFYEGDGPGPDFSAAPAGITFSPPAWDYTHVNGDLCIIGGVLYHGAKFPELQGEYIFGDYISGRIWAASSPSTRPFLATQVSQIASSVGVVHITVQPGTGDILIPNLNSGVIQELGTPSAAVSEPIISLQPASQTISTGSTVVFNVTATGEPSSSFQWSLNGAPIAGATRALLVISGATAASAGAYSCVVTNSAGSVLSASATLAVDPAAASPRLIDISTRGQVGTGANLLIAGFVIGGTTSKTVLIRASGPAIGAAPFNVPGTLSDPALQVFGSGNPAPLVGSNAGWAGDPQIAAAAASVGAFPWTNPAGRDSALLVTLPPGAYTAQVSGVSGDSGVALVEIYDVP